MIRKFSFACLYVIMNVYACFAQQVKHVVVISIDGMRPEFYLKDNWDMPNLKKLLSYGVYAKQMKSVFPSYTYPSHTAMITGALPARSGICYNAKVNGQGEWNWFAKDIKVATIWQAIKSTGMTSAAVQWPVGATNDITYDIPEIWDVKKPNDRITEARKYATPGLIEDIEQNATGELTERNMNERSLAIDENSGKIAAYLFKKYKPNLLAVHLIEADYAQHLQGLDGDFVQMAVSNADKAVGCIIESIEQSGLKDSTVIIVVGDHGFSDTHNVLHPNFWLKQNNIEGKFETAGGSAFLYLKDISQLSKVKSILSVVQEQHKNLFSIYDRKKLDEMGADSNATLALSAFPGTIFSSTGDTIELTPTKGGFHGYDPNLKEMYTGFIAAGPKINKGKEIDELCVTDIAPLIAKLLGIDFKCPDGKLPHGVIKQ